MEAWMVSKLTSGNTYVLKERDERNVVVAMHILHPGLVRPNVAELDGSVWYSLGTDPLAGVDKTDIMIPESEIIHDRFPALGGHRLWGVSPITACGQAAMLGLNIQNMSNKFFINGARPSGILSVPPEIPEETAQLYKNKWEANYSQANIGKVAVLGGGMKYEPIVMMTSQDAQLIEQLKMTESMVCTAFGVPPHKIGIGPAPNISIESLDMGYYSGCLQKLIEAVESCLDKGLGLEDNGLPYQTQMNIRDLLKMDTPTRVKTYSEAVKGILSADEVRQELGYVDTPGGNAVLSQQQNFSLPALAKRDAKDDPFATAPKPAAAPAPQAEPDETETRQLHQAEYRAALQQAVNDARTH
jgi:HK97 family phage portal protein